MFCVHVYRWKQENLTYMQEKSINASSKFNILTVFVPKLLMPQLSFAKSPTWKLTLKGAGKNSGAGVTGNKLLAEKKADVIKYAIETRRQLFLCLRILNVVMDILATIYIKKRYIILPYISRVKQLKSLCYQ